MQASGEFLEQFANAPFTTTYQTVVKLGQGVYTVIANPGLVLNGAVDIAAKLLDPNVDPKVKDTWPPTCCLRWRCLAARR